MSAFGGKADIDRRCRNVCSLPKTDMKRLVRLRAQSRRRLPAPWSLGACAAPRLHLNGSALSPKLSRRKIRALAHRPKLLPHNRGMNFSLVKRLRGEPAVRASHDTLASD